MDADSKDPRLDKPIPESCSITLDILQYIFYRSGHIDIYTPDGIRLETIGYGIKRDDIEGSAYRLKEQIYLMACLLGNLNSKLEFPAQALTALANLLYGMRKFCREYIR